MKVKCVWCACVATMDMLSLFARRHGAENKNEQNKNTNTKYEKTRRQSHEKMESCERPKRKKQKSIKQRQQKPRPTNDSSVVFRTGVNYLFVRDAVLFASFLYCCLSVSFSSSLSCRHVTVFHVVLISCRFYFFLPCAHSLLHVFCPTSPCDEMESSSWRHTRTTRT